MSEEIWPDTVPVPTATGQFLCPDTTKTTRVDFTDFFLRFRHASDAHPVYTHFFLTHQRLAKMLLDHPAMLPNLQQTFSTPAKSKNKVYFMWDFVLRTFQILVAQVSPQSPYQSPAFQEVNARSVMATELILDDTGKMEGMNKRVGFNDDEGVEYSDEIKTLAQTLAQLPIVCDGCGKSEREDGKDLLICAQCKTVRYCSTECQKVGWKFHKEFCKG